MAIIKPYKGVWPKIDDSAFIAENAVIIGDVEIGADSSVWYSCVLRGDVNAIRIGERTNIQDLTMIHCASPRDGKPGIPTKIGNDVTIGHTAIIHACSIEDQCLIGMGACILDGAHIERNAIVGANALVTMNKCVLSLELWGGNPAKKIKILSESIEADMLYSASHYVNLAREHRSITQESRNQS